MGPFLTHKLLTVLLGGRACRDVDSLQLRNKNWFIGLWCAMDRSVAAGLRVAKEEEERKNRHCRHWYISITSDTAKQEAIIMGHNTMEGQ